METGHGLGISQQLCRVLSLPTRNGNMSSSPGILNLHTRFWAYLQGMETSRSSLPLALMPRVLSLPTRNGNQSTPTEFPQKYKRFKPTYKEWKLVRKNSLAGRPEYCFKPTYKEWKLPDDVPLYADNEVLSLPTRNGNCQDPFPEGGHCGRFWAYLQGMETSIFRCPSFLPKLGFKPTYKEWKRINRGFILCARISFKPTYKEWKQNTEVLNLLRKGGFEPTYKEWKRLSNNLKFLAVLVLSLPTRNGN